MASGARILRMLRRIVASGARVQRFLQGIVSWPEREPYVLYELSWHSERGSYVVCFCGRGRSLGSVDPTCYPGGKMEGDVRGWIRPDVTSGGGGSLRRLTEPYQTALCTKPPQRAQGTVGMLLIVVFDLHS